MKTVTDAEIKKDMQSAGIRTRKRTKLERFVTAGIEAGESAAMVDLEAMTIAFREMQAVNAELERKIASLQAWKAAVPLLEIDTVCTSAIVQSEWWWRTTTIGKWLDVVRDDFEYLSDTEREAAMQKIMDGASSLAASD